MKLLLIIGIAVVVFIIQLALSPKQLYFVDSGRYADTARNLIETGQFTIKFTFPTPALPIDAGWYVNLPPVHIYAIAVFQKLFGINDLAVILESGFFYILSAGLVYLIGKRLFSEQVGFFSTLIYVFTPQMLNYAKDGASEPIFIFGLLLVSWLIILNSRLSLCIAGLVSGLLIFTKLQSYLFVPVFFVWVILHNWKQWQKLLLFLGGPILLVLLNKLHLFFGNYDIGVPTYVAFAQTPLFPSDNLPRLAQEREISTNFFLQNIKVLVSKVFYNLYNFYKIFFLADKQLPDFAPGVINLGFISSFIGLLQKSHRQVTYFRIIVSLMLIGSFVLASASSPLIRYIHPIIPLVIILAVSFFDEMFSKFAIKLIKMSSAKLGLSAIFVLFFLVPFLGQNILDRRFEAAAYNLNQPYAQTRLGQQIGETSLQSDIVVTNLDTWGSWYGNRRTILIPLDIQNLEAMDKNTRIDKIFLTDYQKDNPNHAIEGEWAKIFNQEPFETENFFTRNFTLEKEATNSAQQVYENQNYSYKIWKRR